MNSFKKRNFEKHKKKEKKFIKKEKTMKASSNMIEFIKLIDMQMTQ